MKINELIAYCPILFLLSIGTAYSWILGGWHKGIIIPLAILIAILTMLWTDHWNNKNKKANSEKKNDISKIS